MKEAKITKYQKNVLKTLAGRVDNFYLAGGTALSLFYFQHRLSVDLDFFTLQFNTKEIRQIMKFLSERTKAKVELIGQSLNEAHAKIMVYNIYFANKDVVKIDFVEDIHPVIKKCDIINGIKIMSLEDIYIRKIYALTGYVEKTDETGRLRMAGGRSDAKDFYDIYYLSHTFSSLSKFTDKYCSTVAKEGLIRWFRVFDRMKMKGGILDLDTPKKTDYKILERHFEKEINKIAERAIEKI